MFKKAKPQQAKLKMSLYGPQGSGKTFTTLLFAEGLAAKEGKRIAYVDTEHGTDFYAQEVADRSIHPNEFDFDAIYTKSLYEILAAVKSVDLEKYSVIVIDSISHVWDAALDAYSGKRTKSDTIPMHAWAKIKKPYKELINYLIGSNLHTFILGRQKNLFETDNDTGEMRKTGVAMRAEGETPYEPHICLRTECKIDLKDTTRSNYIVYVEKDRTGVLSGQTIINPNFNTIMPLLPLLGDIQAEQEDEVERISKDAELMSETETKREAAKEEKSVKIFDDMQVSITKANSIDELGVVGAEIKKQKKYLMEPHENSLRLLYTRKREQLVEASAKDI